MLKLAKKFLFQLEGFGPEQFFGRKQHKNKSEIAWQKSLSEKFVGCPEGLRYVREVSKKVSMLNLAKNVTFEI